MDAKKLDKIIEYCKQDVQIARDLFLFGQDHGYVEYTSRTKNAPTRLNVDWKIENFIKA